MSARELIDQALEQARLTIATSVRDSLQAALAGITAASGANLASDLERLSAALSEASAALAVIEGRKGSA
jgi:F0F1-type ATP synthase membrane subunit b/b'